MITDAPTATPLASPVAFTVTGVRLDELHVAVFVRSCIVPSLYMPTAASCCVVPAAIAGSGGTTAIDVSGVLAAERAVRVNVRNCWGAAADQDCVDGFCTCTGARRLARTFAR